MASGNNAVVERAVAQAHERATKQCICTAHMLVDTDADDVDVVLGVLQRLLHGLSARCLAIHACHAYGVIGQASMV